MEAPATVCSSAANENGIDLLIHHLIYTASGRLKFLPLGLQCGTHQASSSPPLPLPIVVGDFDGHVVEDVKRILLVELQLKAIKMPVNYPPDSVVHTYTKHNHVQNRLSLELFKKTACLSQGPNV